LWGERNVYVSVPVLGGENSATFWRVKHVHNLWGDLWGRHPEGGHVPCLWGEECATSWTATHVPCTWGEQFDHLEGDLRALFILAVLCQHLTNPHTCLICGARSLLLPMEPSYIDLHFSLTYIY
jgi:hypothetical protein